MKGSTTLGYTPQTNIKSALLNSVCVHGYVVRANAYLHVTAVAVVIVPAHTHVITPRGPKVLRHVKALLLLL